MTLPRHLVAISVLAMFSITACSLAPSPSPVASSPSTAPPASPTPVASHGPLPSDELGDPPPAAVQEWLGATLRAGFRPLTKSEQALVRVTVADARRAGLAQPPGGYESNGGKITWTKVGCVFLGYYKGPSMPSDGDVPAAFPAYLVQVIGQPVSAFPNLNIQAVIINAETGNAETMYSTVEEPVLGTTCGVTS